MQRWLYDATGSRLSVEIAYADGTARGETNAGGESGENFASDFAVNEIAKGWHRANLLGTTLYVADGNGEVTAHARYDAWGRPMTETYIDANFSGLESVVSFASYSWDEALSLWYAQARFYDSAAGRFISEDPVRDGGNWYVYCGGNPVGCVDLTGLEKIVVSGGYYSNSAGYQYEFIDSALKEIISYTGRERSTLFIANAGITQKDIDTIQEYANSYGFGVIYFSDVGQLNNYIDNGSDFKRVDDPITKFRVFSHGYKGSVEFGHGLGLSDTDKEKFSWTIDKISQLSPNAFEKTNSIFYSCNAGTTVNETSFAQEWSNIAGGNTKAAIGQTAYSRINVFVWWRLNSWIAYKLLRDAAGGYSVPYPAFSTPGLGSGSTWKTFKP
jgi:RHS repeat-associated protein